MREEIPEHGFTKKALKREPGYPIGSAAPMYLVCVCGQKVSVVKNDDVVCPVCLRRYDDRGWILKPV